jgi:uncharacterized membrane-anchored protein YhcB (DUF1043 family)
MALTRKQLIIIGGVVTTLVIALVVGITVGVVVNRRKSTSLTIEQRTHEILANNPLIDG